MSQEAPEIRLIRETLEGVLHPSTAASVFFEALQATGGSLPHGPQEAVALVNGPLRASLLDRLGEPGGSIADQLAMTLSKVGRTVKKRPSRHEQKTRSISISDSVLPVFVLTGNRRLVEGLVAAVGPKVMSPVVITDAQMLATRLRQITPAFVLIDAQDFPAIEPEDLVDQISPLDAKVVRALWGSDLPYGQGVMEVALRRRATLTPFDRREGIEPLIDVIRSRHA